MQWITVGVDGSPQADRALAWAVREAELRLATVEVVHCYVVHARGVVMHVPDREQAEERLQRIVERNQHVLDRVKWTAEPMGVLTSASTGLVDVGEGADLIVVGSRGAGGFERLRLGSTGYRTAAHATTPVAVIHEDLDTDRDGRRPLVVGVDGSRAADRALHWAVDEARRREVPLTVANGFEPDADPTMLVAVSESRRVQLVTKARQAAERVVEAAIDGVDTSGLTVDRVVELGVASDVLLSTSGPDRLLVVGTHGRGALGRLVFGSVSHQCLHHADGPVVVVP